MIGGIVGNYQIVKKLGEGGMGAVYLGQHTLLGRRAAIKVLLPELSSRPDIVNRFFNEARAVTSISDPGIVQVFDFGYHTDGSAFIVMEYLEGEPLDRRLARLGKLPVYEGLRLCRQIASSLAAAHAQHITHRDLKPENIFLVHDGEVASGERSKILDFGIAKLSDDNPGKLKTNTGALMGTPIYMSPEQCRGLAGLDHRSDIYSLGCVLFHLITGRPPFEGEGMGDIIAAHIREPSPAPSSRAPEIAPNVDALVLRCLAKAPGDRFQTMVELATAIGQILPHLSSPESPTRYLYVGGPGGPGGPTPVPPYPSQHPQYPSQHPSQHPQHPSQHPQHPSQHPSGYPAPTGTKPTTLGASSGQLAMPPATPVPMAPRRSRKLAGWLVGIAVLGGAGTGVAVVATRGGTGSQIEAAQVPPAAPPPAAPAAPLASTTAAIAPVGTTPSGTAPAAAAPTAAAPAVAVPAATAPAATAPAAAAPAATVPAATVPAATVPAVAAAPAVPGALDAGAPVTPSVAPDVASAKPATTPTATSAATAPAATAPAATAPAATAPAATAPAKHPHRSHATAAPHTGSSTTPAGCDRSIDADCDGIPDVR
ncbi:MAG TPA: serine/threonine-protein kinase [Kofleriaceae bacterium]|nr:serine/threonine-protein kinase [Kofleriaceae bacterium]